MMIESSRLKKSTRIKFLTPIVGMVAMAAVIAPSHAQISYVDMFRSSIYQQTGNGNTLSVTGYFLNVALNEQSSGDFTSGNITATGSINPSLTVTGTTVLGYQTSTYAAQALMDSDFPKATYTFNGTGGSQGSLSATLVYNTDVYPTQQPYLTGTGYSSLQGVNVSAPISLQFSSFAADANAANQYQFFTIYDNTTNTLKYDAGFLSQTATGVTIAANTLTAGDKYTYELIDSNRVSTTGTGATFTPFLGFDLRTEGTFTAAASNVPEPGSLALLASGVLSGIGFLARRGRAAKQC